MNDDDFQIIAVYAHATVCIRLPQVSQRKE